MENVTHVEPKIGDSIVHRGRLTKIEGFCEDSGTFLGLGDWVCISQFEKGDDGVWRSRENLSSDVTPREQADNFLEKARKAAAAIRTGWANPQYGVCIEDEVRSLLDTFEALDQSLLTNGPFPSEWVDGRI